jgi:uncharacterized membrane protein
MSEYLPPTGTTNDDNSNERQCQHQQQHKQWQMVGLKTNGVLSPRVFFLFFGMFFFSIFFYILLIITWITCRYIKDNNECQRQQQHEQQANGRAQERAQETWLTSLGP